jgi:hypothetical protein
MVDGNVLSSGYKVSICVFGGEILVFQPAQIDILGSFFHASV